MPRTKRVHALKRPRLRQDWSKWNLYNLSRVTTPPANNKTFFQQKWTAKSLLRSYHNSDVREGTWTRMFDRRLPSVVPMDHRYLAAHDGSEMAGGRGMGAEKQQIRRSPATGGRDRDGERRIEKTPYMHMTFHPLERRLDTAIFRAMFASSVREARQFVVHGWVKVNGKKMIYSGYQLNPGDMFQVDPDRVMFATGQKKLKADSVKSAKDLRIAAEEAKAKKQRKGREVEELDEEEEELLEEEEESEAGAATIEGAEGAEVDKTAQHSKELKKLMRKAQTILDDSKGDLSGKRQQDLRGFRKQVKQTFAKIRGMEESQIEESVDNLETMLADILVKVPADAVPKEAAPEMGSKEAAEAAQAAAEKEQLAQDQQISSNPQMQDGRMDNYKARKDAELLAAALERARANPIDASKPYATPWQPRDWMSAFAFIPRYLEVNQNICSAVYLRHPVARPGLAEVPTPFSAETMALGFNWYLRRR